MRGLIPLSLLLLSTSHLIASSEQFNPCFQKNSQSIYTLANIECLAVTTENLICHDPLDHMGTLPPGYAVVNFDPFTKIYEIETPEQLTPVKFKGLSQIASGSELALIEKKKYTLGEIESYSNGFDEFGRFSQKETLGKVIGAKCYTVVGIGSEGGRYVSSEFIQSFIAKKNSIYGDIGIRLAQKGECFVVAKRDLFFPDNPFLKGDEILSINGKRFDRFDALTFTVLFAQPGTLFDVKIRRDGEVRTLKVKSGRRYGGGFLADTFLERFGLIFDTKLRVKKIEEGSYAYRVGMKVGDRLLQFDGKPIENIAELTEFLTQKKNRYSSILFDRDGFQFFFTIP